MRPLYTLLVLLLLLPGISACRIGKDPSKSIAATSPFGARMVLEFEENSGVPGLVYGNKLWGELLAVTDTGFLVDNGADIILFSFGSFKEAKLDKASSVGTLNGNAPALDRLEKARLFSRYPYGLTETQLAALLKDRGQEALIVR